ncbi:MAG: YqaE/Pmp3 family membrane protein [Phormidesmis sp.]
MSKLIRYGLGVALPPLGVFLTYGISPAFFINLPLTLLGWVPGSIHAVWAISKHYEVQHNETLQASRESLEANV